MLDVMDPTESALRLVLMKALRGYDDAQLLGWLEDNEPILRTAAARELHMRPNDATFRHLTKLSKSRRHETREAAAFALSQFGTPACPFAEASFDLLSKLLRDDYHEVRTAAIAAIGQLATLGHKPKHRLQEFVLALAADPNATIREAVAYCTLSLGGEHVDDVLRSLLDDEHPEVRDAAEFSFEARQEAIGHAPRVQAGATAGT